MKRLWLILGLLLVIVGPVFAQTDELTLSINSQTIELKSPVILDESGVFLGPVEEFFSALNVPVEELPSRHLSIFRDNIFVKFRPESPYFELNGREYRWKVMPTTKDGVLYVELDVFLKYMDLAYTYHEDNQTLAVRTSKALDSYRPDSTSSKQVPSQRTGLRYSVPSFWSQLDSGYGTMLLDQQVVFNLDRLPTNETGLEDAITDYLSNPALGLGYSETLQQRSLNAPLFKATIVTYHKILEPAAEETSQRMSQWGFFELEDQYFVASLESNLNDPPYLEQVFNDILMSIESNAFSIDSLSEHYVEFQNYSSNKTFISSPVYSNIRTNGQLKFRGNIQPGIEYLDVQVKKGQRTFEYQIPVTYGAFDESIPIPFGLGFHQVTILIPEGVEVEPDVYLEEDPKTLLKFSVINRTLGESLLVSSSKLVNKDHELVKAVVKEIDSKLTNYEKAEIAFHKLEQFSSSTNQTMDQLLADNSGNSQAIASVYTSYLRAMNIPTRLLKIHYGVEYYVEFFSNGQWIFTRPGNFIRDKTSAEWYFNVPRPSGIRLDLLDY